MSAMSRPRIGITCSPLRGEAYYNAYVRAIESAGAEPVMLWSAESSADSPDGLGILARVDGLLIPGGWDVDPLQYGEQRSRDVIELDPALDRTEMRLVREARDACVPVLGICRGQQLINVALGGSLFQHIDGHDLHGRPRDLLSHSVEIEPDSEFGQVVSGESSMVNSLHHQAVGQVAPGLRVTARSPDGVVEGLESGDGLVVAVQCHPEELVERHAWARSLFSRFVERSGIRPSTGPDVFELVIHDRPKQPVVHKSPAH